MKKLLGCCGLDCENCGAYIATVNDDNEMRIKTAKLWSEWNNADIPPEAINCKTVKVIHDNNEEAVNNLKAEQ